MNERKREKTRKKGSKRHSEKLAFPRRRDLQISEGKVRWFPDPVMQQSVWERRTV
jgi:hypothetical protein